MKSLLEALRCCFKCCPVEEKTGSIGRGAIRAGLSSDADYDAATGGHYALNQIAHDFVRVADKSGVSSPIGRTRNLNAAAEQR